MNLSEAGDALLNVRRQLKRAKDSLMVTPDNPPSDSPLFLQLCRVHALIDGATTCIAEATTLIVEEL
jgi:hypothetical protein